MYATPSCRFAGCSPGRGSRGFIRRLLRVRPHFTTATKETSRGASRRAPCPIRPYPLSPTGLPVHPVLPAHRCSLGTRRRSLRPQAAARFPTPYSRFPPDPVAPFFPGLRLAGCRLFRAEQSAHGLSSEGTSGSGCRERTEIHTSSRTVERFRFWRPRSLPETRRNIGVQTSDSLREKERSGERHRSECRSGQRSV